MQPRALKAKRAALGMTQDQLAEALGVDVMTISRWERGARTIPPFLLLALEAIEQRTLDRAENVRPASKKFTSRKRKRETIIE